MKKLNVGDSLYYEDRQGKIKKAEIKKVAETNDIPYIKDVDFL